MKKIAIIQSSYIPWKGYFDIINQVDTFVFLEDVQFTKRDWRTRNIIKTKNGKLWLTIPIVKVDRETKIFKIKISDHENWQEKHYTTILHNYQKALFFKDYLPLLKKIYLEKKWENLSEFNIFTTKLIAETLGITTNFVNSLELEAGGKKADKLINICKKVGASAYLSGPAAKNYIEPEKFEQANIKLEYIEYNYPEYPQLHGKFEHFVSILDVLFHCGKDAPRYVFTKNF